jgi:hypothetical protein
MEKKLREQLKLLGVQKPFLWIDLFGELNEYKNTKYYEGHADRQTD